MINSEKKVAVGLRLAVILFFTVFVMMIPVQAVAQWDQLNREEQQQVLEQLKANLPDLLLTKEAKSDIESALSQGLVWSQLAGEISKGDFPEAIKLTLDYGQGQLVASLEAEIDQAMTESALPDTLKGAYVYVKNNPVVTKKVATEMLQGNWGEAGKLVLNQANSELKAMAVANFTTAYNWVFGDRVMGSVGPADVILFLVRAEIEYIPKWSAMLRGNKLQQMFEGYLGEGRNWESFTSTGADFGTTADVGFFKALTRGGAFGTLQFKAGELRALFESCEGDIIAKCIEDAKKKIKREKDAIREALREVGEQHSEELNRELDKVRKELNRLVAEQNEEFQSAFNEAQSIAIKIKSIADSTQIQYDAFEAQVSRAEAALQKVTDAEAAVLTIQGFINQGEDCASLEEDLTGLSADLDRLKQFKTDFDRSLSQVEPAAREVCAASSEVLQASSRTVARPSLDTAVQRGRNLETLVSRVEGIVAAIRSGNADMTAAIKVKKIQLEQLASSISDTTAQELAFGMIEAAKGARQEFDAARSAMETAINKIDSLKNEFEQVNPVELGVMDRLDGLLRGGINKDEKRRMVNLLSKYRKYPGVDGLLAIHSDAVSVLSRADYYHRQWDDKESRSGRWSFRQWREAEIPANLQQDYEQTLRQCRDLPSSSEFEDIANQASRLAEDMEIREVELWVHKNDADRCIADALVAYNNLPDDGPDTSAIGLIEKAEGKIRAAQASVGTFNEVKVNLEAAANRYAGAVSGMRESQTSWLQANRLLGTWIDQLEQDITRTRSAMQTLENGYRRLADAGLNLRRLANAVCAVSAAPQDKIVAWRNELRELTAEVTAAAADTEEQHLQYLLDKVKVAYQSLKGEAQAARLQYIVIEGQGDKAIKAATAIGTYKKQLGVLIEKVSTLKAEALGLLTQAETALTTVAPDQDTDLVNRIQTARGQAEALGTGLSIPNLNTLVLEGIRVQEPGVVSEQVRGWLGKIDGRLRETENVLAEAKALPGDIESIRVAGEFATRTVPEHLARASTCLVGITPETQAVTVEDTTKPSLNDVPADITAEATSASGAAASYSLPTASDDVDPAPSVSCGPASGSTFPLGSTPVTCVATDASGNSNDASFTVTIQDTTPPTFETLGSIRAEATSASGAVGSYSMPTASDVVDPAPVVSCSPASGSTFPLGSTSVTCVATDASGNSSDAGFVVTIVEKRPGQPPTSGEDDGEGEGYDPLADPNVGRPQPSPTQLTRAQEAGSAVWMPAAGEDDGAGTSAGSSDGTGQAGQPVGCEYSGTCDDEATEQTQPGESLTDRPERETGEPPDDWADEFDPDKALPTSSRPAKPPGGSDREPTTQQAPPPTQQPAKDQKKRTPTQPAKPAGYDCIKKFQPKYDSVLARMGAAGSVDAALKLQSEYLDISAQYMACTGTYPCGPFSKADSDVKKAQHADCINKKILPTFKTKSGGAAPASPSVKPPPVPKPAPKPAPPPPEPAAEPAPPPAEPAPDQPCPAGMGRLFPGWPCRYF
ncbi:HYR domain-containing protein [Pseudomonadota bacterium]